MTDIQMIPISLIDPHPHNPRRDMGSLTEMVKSIKAQGIRQNLLLIEQPPRPIGPARYTVVIGHRRLAAAKKAGLTEVPAAVAELTDAEQLELMLVENVQRTNLTVIEEAEGYQGLLDLGMDTDAIAKTTGRAAKTVQGRVRLLALPDAAKEKVHAEQATLEDAAKILEFEDDPQTAAKLAAELGGNNFGWTLSEARRERHRRAAQDVLIARAEELGVTEWDPDADRTGWLRREVSTIAQLEELAPAAGSRWQRSQWFDSIDVLFQDQNGDLRTSQEVADEAARAAVAAANKRAREDGDLAATLRLSWVKEYVKRAKVSAAHTDAILAATTRRIVTGDLWGSSSSVGFNIDAMQPICHLLIMATHSAKYSLLDQPRVRELYELLVKLGYELSDVEHARLYPDTVTGVCRECGCTDEDACTDPEPCHWVEPDLCSACAAIDPSYVPEGL